jgi:hypothetical protein
MSRTLPGFEAEEPAFALAVLQQMGWTLRRRENDLFALAHPEFKHWEALARLVDPSAVAHGSSPSLIIVPGSGGFNSSLVAKRAADDLKTAGLKVRRHAQTYDRFRVYSEAKESTFEDMVEARTSGDVSLARALVENIGEAVTPTPQVDPAQEWLPGMRRLDDLLAAIKDVTGLVQGPYRRADRSILFYEPTAPEGWSVLIVRHYPSATRALGFVDVFVPSVTYAELLERVEQALIDRGYQLTRVDPRTRLDAGNIRVKLPGTREVDEAIQPTPSLTPREWQTALFPDEPELSDAVQKSIDDLGIVAGERPAFSRSKQDEDVAMLYLSGSTQYGEAAVRLGLVMSAGSQPPRRYLSVYVHPHAGAAADWELAERLAQRIGEYTGVQPKSTGYGSYVLYAPKHKTTEAIVPTPQSEPNQMLLPMGLTFENIIEIARAEGFRIEQLIPGAPAVYATKGPSYGGVIIIPQAEPGRAGLRTYSPRGSPEIETLAFAARRDLLRAIKDAGYEAGGAWGHIARVPTPGDPVEEAIQPTRKPGELVTGQSELFTTKLDWQHVHELLTDLVRERGGDVRFFNPMSGVRYQMETPSGVGDFGLTSYWNISRGHSAPVLRPSYTGPAGVKPNRLAWLAALEHLQDNHIRFRVDTRQDVAHLVAAPWKTRPREPGPTSS